MRKWMMSLTLGTLLLALLAFAGTAFASGLNASHHEQGNIVVANRASGDVSIIEVGSDDESKVALPPGTNSPEPMYVVYSKHYDRVFVGDRANNRVVVFDANDMSVETTVPAGAGVFHMWSDPQNKQLWVNNDIDKTATVIDPRTLAVLTTVPMPPDLVAEGGKPHDVVLDNRFAYVTMVGFSSPNDYVVKFSKRTFAEVDRAAVGKDPHVSLTKRNQYLYVPAQNSDVVTVLDRGTLNLVTELDVPGAHGAGMAVDGKTFYTTNLPGGGTSGLRTIDTSSNLLIDGGGTDTPHPVPHNIAAAGKAPKLYVTHSGGTSDKVSVYSISKQDPVPVLVGEVTVGLNPFGLAYVP